MRRHRGPSEGPDYEPTAKQAAKYPARPFAANTNTNTNGSGRILRLAVRLRAS